MTLQQRETYSRQVSKDEFDFDADDLEPKEFPVKYKGKKYLLREADESTAIRYQDAIFQALSTDEEGRPTKASGLAQIEVVLLGGCIWELSETGIPVKQVGDQALMTWGHRVIKPLFERAKKISGLDDDNDPSAIQKQIDRLSRKRNKLLFGVEDPSTKKGSNAPANGAVSIADTLNAMPVTSASRSS